MVVARAFVVALRAIVFVALRADDGVVTRAFVVALRAAVFVRAALRAVAVRLTVLRAVVRVAHQTQIQIINKKSRNLRDSFCKKIARLCEITLAHKRAFLLSLSQSQG